MNYIKHLTGFFEKVVADHTINATHISLYIALFQCWNCNRFRNPISITRDELMRISKISSKATYHKCLKALHANGYIKYEPSYNPFKGSHVFLFNFAEELKPQSKTSRKASPIFEPVGKQLPDRRQAGNETAVEQLVVPYVNNSNKANSLNQPNALNKDERAGKSEEPVSGLKTKGREKEKKSSAKKKEKLPPEQAQVLTFFEEQLWPAVEANKFFNYFQSIGWLVGGRTPMADWKAGARNWMLHDSNPINNDSNPANRTFDTSATKNYAEPL